MRSNTLKTTPPAEIDCVSALYSTGTVEPPLFNQPVGQNMNKKREHNRTATARHKKKMSSAGNLIIAIRFVNR